MSDAAAVRAQRGEAAVISEPRRPHVEGLCVGVANGNAVDPHGVAIIPQPAPARAHAHAPRAPRSSAARRCHQPGVAGDAVAAPRAKTVQTGCPRRMRSPENGMSRTSSRRSQRSLSPTITARRAYSTALPSTSGSVAGSKAGQGAAAGGHVGLEDAQPAPALDQLHRSRVARVDLEHVGLTVPEHEVDAVEADQAEGRSWRLARSRSSRSSRAGSAEKG